MLDRLDEVSDERVKTLDEIERNKLKVAKAYNKSQGKTFQVRDLIWKTILSIGSRRNKFEKWSSNWEGPYRIEEVISRNSYMVQNIQGTSLSRALNGKYLKSIILVFDKTLELKIANNGIIALSTKKWLMKHYEHHPEVKFGLKCLLICKLN
jgi:hypothetical protein